jgi:hypothetical protein
MKLSWRDVVATLVAIGGGSIVYAKHYGYSWATIGSWRSAVAALALVGLVMFAFSSFDFANRSILNLTEMVLGSLAVVLAVIGVIMTSKFVFYSLAAVLGVAWLINTARHARHSIVDHEHHTPTLHHHAPIG